MTNKLTAEQRDWRQEMVKAIAKVRTSIRNIDGAYGATVDAIAALDQLSDIAIDDVDMGPCAHCGEAIWELAGDESVHGEDDVFCLPCVERWKQRDAEADQENTDD